MVCYDVRDEKRYRKVFKIVKGAGEPVQYSIFRCRLDDRETERLRWRLAQVMAPEDALLIVDLCPRCARNVIARNHVDGWAEEPPTFRIIGAGCDHAPASVSHASDAEASIPAKKPGDRGD